LQEKNAKVIHKMQFIFVVQVVVFQ